MAVRHTVCRVIIAGSTASGKTMLRRIASSTLHPFDLPRQSTVLARLSGFICSSVTFYQQYLSIKLTMFEEIRKFGLDHHDLPTLLANVSALLRPLTLNIDSRHHKRVPIIFYFIMLVSFSCYVYVYQVSVFWFIMFRGTEDELVKKIIAFSQCVITMVGVNKFLFMYWNKYELKKIIDAYLLCDSTVVPFSRMSRNIDMTLRIVKRRALVFWITVTSNVVLYVVVRPLAIDRHSMIDYPQLWGLDPMLESPNFEISVMVLSAVVPIAVFGVVHIVILLIVMVGYSEAYMLALSQDLLYLWEDSEIDFHLQSLGLNTKRNTSIDDFVKCRLENIIKSHAQNQQLINDVDNVFRNGTTFQFVFLSMSLVAVLLGGLENTYTQIPFALGLVGVDCLTGQNVMDASLTFEAAVYRCKWEKFDRNNMKLVLIILQNAQKTMKLTAGGVARLNYACFLYIVKSIYSVYAALQPSSLG